MDGDNDIESLVSERRGITKTGKILLGITGASVLAVTCLTGPFLLPAFRKFCLPYVPATTQQQKIILHILKGKSGRVVDLGSGDGRVVVDLARQGFQAHGVELNPWLVWYSRYQAWRQGVRTNTKFFSKDLWKVDMSVYDHVIIFGVDTMMEPLERKLGQELCCDSHVIACRFPLPTWTAVKTIEQGIDTVWLYKKPSSAKS